MTVVKQLLVLVLLGALVVAAIFVDLPTPFGRSADQNQDAGPEEPAAPVVVETVRFASSAAVVETVGTGSAVNEVVLFPNASGRITEMHVRAGDQVTEGQVLLRLDSEEERLGVELARVHVQEAEQQLARYERAAPSGAVSAGEVDTARTALAAVRVELEQAELALRQRTLRAPFAGVVGIPEVEAGDRVTESTAIATLDDRSTIRVTFEVPETFAAGVAIGQPVVARTWALPGATFEGTIEALASRIDPQTRTLRTEARIPNEDDRLRTGMSFSIRLPLQGERFPSIPSLSLQWDREGPGVWMIIGEQAEWVPVAVIKREDTWVLVDAPLTAGDRVVIEGVQRLRPGRQVDIREPDPAPEGPDAG